MRHLCFWNILLCTLSVFLLSASCTRSERDEDIETLSARELALGYHIIDDAIMEVHKASLSNTALCNQAGSSALNSCLQSASLNENGSFPKTLVLDYGQENNTCDDGQMRYGIIRARFTDKYLESGSEITITFQDFQKGGFELSGTVSLTCMGRNSDGTYRIYWSVEDANVTGINTDFSWEGAHTRYWTLGDNGDGDWSDDGFRIDGFSTGRNSRGNTWTNEITRDYLSDMSCNWITDGRSSLSIPNLELRTLNFGENDSCNNVLIERRNNTYFEVTIPD